jgi:hypothetical protein
MKIYNYNEHGYYTSESTADESPLEPGKFLIPANATKIAPPAEQAGSRRKFVGGSWQQETIPTLDIYHFNSDGEFTTQETINESHRGYNKFDIPGYATDKPPLAAKDGFKVKFGNDEWVYEEIIPEPELIDVVRFERDRLLKESDVWKFDDFPRGVVTEPTINTYRQELRDFPATVDLTGLTSIDEVTFPTKPF